MSSAIILERIIKRGISQQLAALSPSAAIQRRLIPTNPSFISKTQITLRRKSRNTMCTRILEDRQSHAGCRVVRSTGQESGWGWLVGWLAAFSGSNVLSMRIWSRTDATERKIRTRRSRRDSALLPECARSDIGERAHRLVPAIARRFLSPFATQNVYRRPAFSQFDSVLSTSII